MRFIAVLVGLLLSGIAEAQNYPPPAYPPQNYPPPAYPPQNYPPPAYPPAGYPPPGSARPRLAPPWLDPRPFRGYFGLSIFGSFIANQSGGIEYLHHGGGLGLYGGVDIGRFFGVELSYSASFHNPFESCAGNFAYSWCGASYLMVESIGIDAKFHIPTGTRFVPYAQAGAMVSWIGRSDYPADALGGGFEAGGGFDVWVSRHMTVGLQALYRGLFMDDYAAFTGTSTYISFVNVSFTLAGHF